jgi:hypothetical protein
MLLESIRGYGYLNMSYKHQFDKYIKRNKWLRHKFNKFINLFNQI